MSTVRCAFPFISSDAAMPNKLDNRQNRLQVNIGPCKWIFAEKCPNSDIKFYLYTRKNAQDRQLIHVDETWEKSNLTDSHFNPNDPSKIILHGYNSDMFLTPLIQMKGGMFNICAFFLLSFHSRRTFFPFAALISTIDCSNNFLAKLWNLVESFEWCNLCALLLKMNVSMVLIAKSAIAT